MSDQLWEELVRSPLDPDPNEVPRSLPWFVPIAIAGLGGLLVGFIGFGGADDPPTSAPPTTIPATTLAVEEPDPVVPDGYVEVSGVGLRALASYSSNGNLYIVLNEAARSDLDPTETGSFHGAVWELEGDGTSVTASQSLRSRRVPSRWDSI